MNCYFQIRVKKFGGKRMIFPDLTCICVHAPAAPLFHSITFAGSGHVLLLVLYLRRCDSPIQEHSEGNHLPAQP